MITKILATVIAFFLLTGCAKDKYTTKPQLKYKSVNTKELRRNETLTFTLEVTDAQGDLQDTIWVKAEPRNCADRGFQSAYQMPIFSGQTNFKGEISVCYTYALNRGCPFIGPTCPNGASDSATFKFWIQDKAKNMSDTISSEEIVIVQ